MFRSCKKITLIVLCFVASFFFFSENASAHVMPGYEWKIDSATGKPARNLHIWCGDEVSQQWKDLLDEAIANWENANTGWTFEVVDEIEGSDITFHTASIPPNTNGRKVAGRTVFDYDSSTGETIGCSVTMNTDPSISWGTSGDNKLDPVKVIKHELGHTLGLDHDELGNLMDTPVYYGDHECEPNNADIQQAKDSAAFDKKDLTAGEKEQDSVILDAAGKASLVLDKEDFPYLPGDAQYPVILRYFSCPIIPEPLSVPQGFDRIVASAGIFPLDATFFSEAELTIVLDEDVINGFKSVGEYEYYAFAPVDMEKAEVFRLYDTGEAQIWETVDLAWVYDAVQNEVSIIVPGGGIYGIAAPVKESAPVQYAIPFVDMIVQPGQPDLAPMVLHCMTRLNIMGIYRGYPDGSAGFYKNLTRVEFAAIAVRLAGLEEESLSLNNKRPAFTDEVPAWAWGYVNQAVDAGFIKGYPDGSFGAYRDVTGNEVVTVLVRLAGEIEEALSASQTWPLGYIETADALGILDNMNLYTGQQPGEWGKLLSAVHKWESFAILCYGRRPAI